MFWTMLRLALPIALPALPLCMACGRTDIDAWSMLGTGAGAVAGTSAGVGGFGGSTTPAQGGSAGVGGANGIGGSGGAFEAGEPTWILYAAQNAHRVSTLVAQDLAPLLTGRGDSERRVLSDQGVMWPPIFASDGRTMAFVDGTPGSGQHLHVAVLADTSPSVRQLRSAGTIARLSWASEDARLAWLQQPDTSNEPWRLAVADIDDGVEVEFDTAYDAQICWLSGSRLTYHDATGQLLVVTWTDAREFTTRRLAVPAWTRVKALSALGNLALLASPDRRYWVANFDRRSIAVLEVAPSSNVAWSTSPDFQLLSRWDTNTGEGWFVRASSGVPVAAGMEWAPSRMTSIAWANTSPRAVLLAEPHATAWQVTDHGELTSAPLEPRQQVLAALFSEADDRLAIVDAARRLWVGAVEGNTWPPTLELVASGVEPDTLMLTADPSGIAFVSDRTVVNYRAFGSDARSTWNVASAVVFAPHVVSEHQVLVYLKSGARTSSAVEVQSLPGSPDRGVVRLGECAGSDDVLCAPTEFMVQPNLSRPKYTCNPK